jgi:hypothetical protein
VGIAAGTSAVLNGLGASTTALPQASAADVAAVTSQSVAFGHSRVVVRMQSGLACFRVQHGRSTVARSCAPHLQPDEIGYATSRDAVGGVAGSGVRAVIVRLTKKGTVWATMRRGTFYADVPRAYDIRAVVKVLRDGTRRAFTVTGPR